MPEYRRSLLEGGTFFFTVVTYNRLPILMSPEARRLLSAAWEDVGERFPLVIDAVCLLPEHIHYNPVKHGWVERVVEWPWSSFLRYVKMEYYEREWGEAIGEEVRRMGGGGMRIGVVCDHTLRLRRLLDD